MPDSRSAYGANRGHGPDGLRTQFVGPLTLETRVRRPDIFLLRDAAEWRTTALRAAHCVAQVGHARRVDGVNQLQADLPELDAVE